MLVEIGAKLRDQGSICILTLTALTNSNAQMYRLTIRATDQNVPSVLLNQMAERLAEGSQKDR